MKKKFLLLFLFLVSCSSEAVPTGLVVYENDDFNMNVPENWIVYGQDSNLIPKPRVGEVALAISSTEVQNGFSNNLLVLKEALRTELDSQKFTTFNHLWATDEYDFYQSREEKQITFIDEEVSQLFIFEARYNNITPNLTFLQTGRVCKGNVGFFLTIALPANITDVAKYEEILKTFACK